MRAWATMGNSGATLGQLQDASIGQLLALLIVHAVFEAEITLKKCLPLGTNISWFCILSRVDRDQERKNRMGKSFFMHISFSYIKKGGGGGFKIRYRHLFLGPASERNKLERWEWRHWKDLFLQIMNHIWFLKIRAKLTEQTSSKVKNSIFDGGWGPIRPLMSAKSKLKGARCHQEGA